jgi:glycosyltransferase involved in cell wall biosynthesis
MIGYQPLRRKRRRAEAETDLLHLASLVKLSVIIPTHDRPSTLSRCLRAWGRQTRLPEEVVVIDDGSGQETQRVLQRLAHRLPYPLRALRQEASGPATARNVGAAAAIGDVFLFTGDDMIPMTGLAHVHMARHEAGDPLLAVLGLVCWAPFAEVTPLMEWLDRGSRLPQFEYHRLPVSQALPGHFFYTSNVSLHRDLFARSLGFDERFRWAYGEDGELGRRLVKLGMHLEFEPNGVTYHVHPTALAAVGRRAWVAGATAKLLDETGRAAHEESPHRHRRAVADTAARGILATLAPWDARRLPIYAPVGRIINWCLGRRYLAGLNT